MPEVQKEMLFVLDFRRAGNLNIPQRQQRNGVGVAEWSQGKNLGDGFVRQFVKRDGGVTVVDGAEVFGAEAFGRRRSGPGTRARGWPASCSPRLGGGLRSA